MIARPPRDYGRRSARRRRSERRRDDRDLHPAADPTPQPSRLVDAITRIDGPPVLTCFMSSRGLPDACARLRIPSFAYGAGRDRLAMRPNSGVAPKPRDRPVAEGEDEAA
jgi:hypothetical protein